LARAEALRAAAGARTAEPGHGGSLRLTHADPARVDAVRSALHPAPVDLNLVASGLRLADFRLLVLDMDSTLISIECLDELADFAGRKAEVAAVTERAMRGEIDWATSLRERVSTLAGLEATVLERVYEERLQLSAGAETLIATARHQGLRTAVLSGGFTFFTARLRERLGLDAACANELEVADGRLTGRVSGPLVDAQAKARWVATTRDGQGWSKEQVIAVGDGANDLPMFAQAGASVAFRAKPVAKRGARYALDVSGLDGVLGLFPP
jgi:phosphoserine phosphatase